ncbi:MAG: S8 family serine peptidase [Candidatus Omnitrophota bacterium]
MEKKREKRNGGINILKGVIKMRKRVSSEKGDILNRLLFGLGLVIIGLTLAIGFKTLFFKEASLPEEIISENKTTEEMPEELAKEEQAYLEEEIEEMTPLKMGSTEKKLAPPKIEVKEFSARGVKYANREKERFNLAQYLEEKKITVKEIKPMEEFNKLMIDTSLLKEEEEWEGIDFATPLKERYVPGVVMVKQTFSDGSIELTRLEVEEGREEEIIKELNNLPGIEVYRDKFIPIYLCGVPIAKGLPGESPTPGSSETPVPGEDPDLGKQWALPLLGIDDDAWRLLKDYYGTNYPEVKIAIIDTGCDLDHPDLKAHIDTDLSRNFVDKTLPPRDDNEYSHGTHVAGIIGAVIGNGVGIAGIIPQPKLIIIKALDETGSGTASVLAEALSYALNSGARIINMSWGSYDDLLDDNTLGPVLSKAFESDILLVASAGNHAGAGISGESCVLYPAMYEEVLGVGGTNKLDERWVSAEVDEEGSSNPLDDDYNPWYGLPFESAYGERVDIYAPAGDETEDIYSTIIGGYDYLAGTSMSAAFVSGVAGLILTAAPYLTKAELEKILKDTATPIDIKDIEGDPTPEEELRVDAISAVEDLIPLEDEIWITGRVKDSEGKGVKDLTVRVKSADLESDKTAKTNEEGRYLIVLSIDDFKSEEDLYENIKVSVDGRSEYDEVLIEDAILGEYYVVDFSPETAGEDEIIIKGTVRNSAGTVLKEVTVRVKSDDLIEDLTDETDEEGKYRIVIGLEDLEEDKDEYEVKLSVDNHFELGEETIEVKLGGVYTVDFGSSTSNNEIIIRGKVTENGTAKAQVTVKMRLKTMEGTEVATKESSPTDSEGKYEIKFSGLDATKKYKVDLLAPINQNDFRTNLEPGKTYKNYDIEISEDSGVGDNEIVIYGKVYKIMHPTITSSEEIFVPLEKVEVKMRLIKGPYQEPSTITDQNGKYSIKFTNLDPAKKYDVIISKPEFLAPGKSRTIRDLEPGKRYEHNIYVPECSFDSDCPRELQCHMGRCVQCVFHTDCPGGMICDRDFCVSGPSWDKCREYSRCIDGKVTFQGMFTPLGCTHLYEGIPCENNNPPPTAGAQKRVRPSYSAWYKCKVEGQQCTSDEQDAADAYDEEVEKGKATPPCDEAERAGHTGACKEAAYDQCIRSCQWSADECKKYCDERIK